LRNDGAIFPHFNAHLYFNSFIGQNQNSTKGGTVIKILVVSNDLILERMLSVTLTINGFSTVATKNLREALSIIENGKINMLLIDQDVEPHNLRAFLDTIRSSKIDVPILLIGKGQEGWLNILKPVEFPVLKQKMNELFRRKKRLSEKFIMYGDMKIDVARRLVTVKDCIVNLGMMELGILISLARKTGQVVGRDTIRNDLEAQGLFFNTTIHHHMWGLKQKLKSVAGDTFKIKLVLGQGFILTKQT
jgi:DNA-binding response OmpR family regulator